MHVAGLAEPNGFARMATSVANPDGTFTITDTDAAGKLTSAIFDAGHRSLSGTDAAGRVSTAVYDGDATRFIPTGRRTDADGPAPGTCFWTDRQRPEGSCAAPAHTATTYDRDPTKGTVLTGLGATWWANRTLSGLARGHGAVTLGPSGRQRIRVDYATSPTGVAPRLDLAWAPGPVL